MKKFIATYHISSSWSDDSSTERIIEAENFEKAVKLAIDYRYNFNTDYKIELIGVNQEKTN